MAPGVREREGGGGFTAIELLVVIFIVMIMAGITVPAVLRGVRRSRMRSAASQVASGLRRARNLAIASGEIYCANFHNPDPLLQEKRPRVDLYRLNESEIGITPLDWPTLTNQGRFAGGVHLPPGAQLTTPYSASPLPPPPEYVMFYPDGSALAVDFGPPSTVRVVLLWAAGRDEDNPFNVEAYHDITVNSLSGRVSVGDRVRVAGP